MDWGVIAQAIFFLAIGLIAIVVTIFVFSTSLLGLAVKKASSEKKKMLEEQEQKTREQLETLREQFDKAKKEKINPLEIDSLGKEVTKWAKQLRMDEKSLASVHDRYYLPFTVGTGVARPGIGFLLSSILSGIAWSLFNRQPQVGVDSQNAFLVFLPYLLIAAAIIAISYGVYRLYYYNLKAIQAVSITSEELVLRRTIEGFKTAQKEYADENRPKMELEFIEPKPPIQIVVGGKVTIEFSLKLVKGDQGQNARVIFYAPKGFNFIPVEEKTRWVTLLPIDDEVSIEYRMKEDLYPDYHYHRSLAIEAPQETGPFMLSYDLQCLGFTSPSEFFEVSVTPPLTSLPKP